jgi:homocysteine S-methyltransferase
MAPRYGATLTKEERKDSEAISTKGKRAARIVLYARALLLLDAGANFLQTQPVYDVDCAKRFIEKIELLNIPALISVMPLKSVKMAQYMNKNVPGIEVPAHVISQFEKYGSGVPIANEFINGIYEYVSGIHLLAMGHVGNINKIMDHMEGIRGG